MQLYRLNLEKIIPDSLVGWWVGLKAESRKWARIQRIGVNEKKAVVSLFTPSDAGVCAHAVPVSQLSFCSQQLPATSPSSQQAAHVCLATIARSVASSTALLNAPTFCPPL